MTEIVATSAIVSALVSFIVASALRGHVPKGHMPLLSDPEGHLRMEVVADKRGDSPEGIVGLRFLSKAGGTCGGVGTFKDEGTLAFLDENDLPRVSLRIEDQSPRLIFFTPYASRPGIGYRSIVLGLRPDGTHALDFMDEVATVRVSLGTDTDGTGFLIFRDQQGAVVWKGP